MLRNPYSSECVEGKFSEVRRTRSLISPLHSPDCLESSPGLLFPHDTEVVADLFIRWLLNVHVHNVVSRWQLGGDGPFDP